MFSLGSVEPHTAETIEVNITDDEVARRERMSNRPPLDEILNLHDFEVSFQHLPRMRIHSQQTSGYCMASHACESLRILFVCSRRRDYQPRKPCSIS